MLSGMVGFGNFLLLGCMVGILLGCISCFDVGCMRVGILLGCMSGGDFCWAALVVFDFMRSFVEVL